jgi:hypothetical protein
MFENIGVMFALSVIAVCGGIVIGACILLTCGGRD